MELGASAEAATARDSQRLREAALELLGAGPLGCELGFVTAVAAALAPPAPCPCTVTLCRLLLAALQLPAVCQVRRGRATAYDRVGRAQAICRCRCMLRLAYPGALLSTVYM